MKNVLAAPENALQCDARVLHKDGSYCWVESTFSNRLFEPEVNAIVMQQRDINLRRTAEKEKQLWAEELALSNLRLEEFARTVAHDLREPLLAISLYADLMFERTQLDVRTKQMSKIVVESAARMAALIEGLLAFANTGESEAPELVNLAQVVEQAMQNLALPIATSGATITVNVLPVVRSNEARLVSVFQNLISNAIKYRAERPLAINIEAQRRGREWVVSVEDNGVGIAPENRARVFMPFVRLVKRTIPGCGLGLAVCKNTIEQLGGTIWVESESSNGATFRFTLAANDSLTVAPISYGELV